MPAKLSAAIDCSRKSGVTTPFRLRVRWMLTSFIYARSWKPGLKSPVSFSRFTALATSSLDNRRPRPRGRPMVNGLDERRHAGSKDVRLRPGWETSVNKPEEMPRVRNGRRCEQSTLWLARREDPVPALKSNPNSFPAPATSARALGEQLAALRHD